MSSGARSPQVLAVLDDAAAGRALLELSSTLAQAVQRDLSVVYVESAQSLVAAALPFTQVLSHATTQWVPLLPQDVEQGYRAQATRLRELTARITVRHAVSWSLRVVRGSLPGAAIELLAESDLLLMAATPPTPPLAMHPAHDTRHRPVVAVVSNGSAASERALGVAAQLALALGGSLQTARVDATAKLMHQASTVAALLRPDVLVLPGASLAASELATMRCPVLLVG